MVLRTESKYCQHSKQAENPKQAILKLKNHSVFYAIETLTSCHYERAVITASNFMKTVQLKVLHYVRLYFDVSASQSKLITSIDDVQSSQSRNEILHQPRTLCLVFCRRNQFTGRNHGLPSFFVAVSVWNSSPADVRIDPMAPAISPIAGLGIGASEWIRSICSLTHCLLSRSAWL